MLDGTVHPHSSDNTRYGNTKPDNYGPWMWGGDAARADLLWVRKGDKDGTGGGVMRAMVKQRMNTGGVVRNLGDGESRTHDTKRQKLEQAKEERKNLGGLVKIAETRGARVMGQSSGINRESILHPGITRAPVEIGAVQRVIMPIPTPMSAPSGGGGGSAPPSPLSTFGR